MFIFILPRGVRGVYFKTRITSSRENQSIEKLSALGSQKEQLENEINLLECDFGIEARLRNFYSLGKDGEVVIIIIDEEEDPVIIEKPKGFMNKTMSWFRSINLLK
jgi:cell division protein FtsB